MLEVLPQLPRELQEKLIAMPPELRAGLDSLPPALARPDLAPLLRHLVAVGLVTEERTRPDDKNPELTCHDLVRERIRDWMHDQPQDRAELSENTVRLAYAERLEAFFNLVLHRNATRCAARRVAALSSITSRRASTRGWVDSPANSSPASATRAWRQLLPHLEAAAASAPEGESRWSCLCWLADALKNAGRPEASLPFYEQAAAQARSGTAAGAEDGRRAWTGVGWITANWAGTLFATGNVNGSRQRFIESTEAKRKAGASPASVIVSELEVLRIDILRGQITDVLPRVETRLRQVEAWWQRYRSGQMVPEAPDPEYLARAFTAALDVAFDADFAHGDWEQALRRIDAILEVKCSLHRADEDVAADRLNRALVLKNLGRFGQAKAEMEDCLHRFRNDSASAPLRDSALASVSAAQGDVREAIIQERRALAFRAIAQSNGPRRPRTTA